MLLVAALAGGADKASHTRAVYLLVDTFGTYARELDKAQLVINYLLGTLTPDDSLAVGRINSRSFSEKDSLAKATFAKDPQPANGQKRAFKEQLSKLSKQTRGGSAYTDISGGVLQVAEFLNETGAGRRTILVFF